MKEQGQNTPDLTNEEVIGSLPEKEFRIMIVKMIQNLGNRTDKMQETFNKDVEELKRNKATMKNTINEIKNTLEGINSRITEAEERVSDREDKMVEITTAEQNKEKRMKRTEDSPRDLWDNIKRTNRASLVAQWLRICLPMQGTRVRALVWEDPTCRGATTPVSHNY